MNPKPFSLLKNFTVPVAMFTSLSSWCCFRLSRHKNGSGPAHRELRVLGTAGGGLTHRSIDAALLVVAPSDQSGVPADVLSMSGAEEEIRQHHCHRKGRIVRVRTSPECPARWFDSRGRREAAECARRPRIHGGHRAIATRRLVTPRSRRAIFVASAASLSRIRASSRSRRNSSLPTSRRRSSPWCAFRARTKQRCASTARSSSIRRAIVENDVPSSRKARTRASISGAETRCRREDPPRQVWRTIASSTVVGACA